MTALQGVMGALGGLGLAGVLELVRRRRLREGLAALWGVLSGIVLVLAVWPGLFLMPGSGLAEALGLPVRILALMLAGLVLIGVLFVLTLRISRQTDQIKQLAQTQALLEARIAALEAEPHGRGAR